MKTAIIYHSEHHGNTKKVLDAIAEKYEVTLIDADKGRLELGQYGMIGFASGIYYGKFHESVIKYAKKWLPKGKDVFCIYTCGRDSRKYTSDIAKVAEERECRLIGRFGCFGLDTYGPFGAFGGLQKGHPNEADLNRAVAYFGRLYERKTAKK